MSHQLGEHQTDRQNVSSVPSTSNKQQKFLINNHLFMKEAQRRGWTIEIIDRQQNLLGLLPEPEEFYRTKDPNKMIICRRPESELNTAHGRLIAHEKMLTYALAHYYSFPIPESLLYTPEEINFNDELLTFLRKHGRLVVKPTDSALGRGVSTNVTDMESFQTAIEFAKQTSSNIVIQSFIPGKDYRILVLNGHVIAAAYRRPAFVIGDGERTVRQLVEMKNAHPWRSQGYSTPLKTIEMNEVEAFLGQERLKSVPGKGCLVEVNNVANISRGGEAEDVTDIIHVSIRRMAEKITHIAQLSLCGVDLMIDGDIRKPLGPDCKATLIEINALPIVRMHHFPTCGGYPRHVTGIILDEIIRRRQFRAGFHSTQMTDEESDSGQSGQKYFAPILSNPEDFIPSLSHGLNVTHDRKNHR